MYSEQNSYAHPFNFRFYSYVRLDNLSYIIGKYLESAQYENLLIEVKAGTNSDTFLNFFLVLVTFVSPGETCRGETSPGETSPGETSPSETCRGETSPGETSPGKTSPGETSPGDTYLGETSPGETSRGET